MTQKKEIYKCNICGNIVEVLHTGVGELVCCGQPMEKMNEKQTDEGLEKHVPVVEKTENGIKIKVGSNPHPMVENHYIEWIEVVVDGNYQRKFLKPGDAPEAVFCLKGDKITAREYCNVHGLWTSNN